MTISSSSTEGLLFSQPFFFFFYCLVLPLALTGAKPRRQTTNSSYTSIVSMTIIVRTLQLWLLNYCYTLNPSGASSSSSDSPNEKKNDEEEEELGR